MNVTISFIKILLTCNCSIPPTFDLDKNKAGSPTTKRLVSMGNQVIKSGIITGPGAMWNRLRV